MRFLPGSLAAALLLLLCLPTVSWAAPAAADLPGNPRIDGSSIPLSSW